MPPPSPPTSPVLPADEPALIGRDEAQSVLAASLVPGARVALVGPGGCGKTALAGAVARGGGVGVRWCDLSTAHTGADASLALGAALGADVDLALASVGRVVLVLDGVDGVPPDALAALGQRLQPAAELAVLTTSRRPPGWPGEQVVELGPLDPDDAVALFVARVQRRLIGWTPGPDEAPSVRSLVERLDRMPLAIALAAARRPVMTATEMLGHLDARFALLRPVAGQPRPGRALWDVIASSWTALDEASRAVLAQCTVFRGGFTLDAAAAVVDSDGWLVDALQALRDGNLLRTDPAPEPGSGATRYHLYDSVRDFAAAFVDRPDALADRHARWVEAFLDACDQRLHDGPVDRVRDARARERWNAVAAWEHLRASGEHDRALAIALRAAAIAQLDAPGPWLDRVEASVAAVADLGPRAQIRVEQARMSLLFDLGRYAQVLALADGVVDRCAEWPLESARIHRVRGQALARTGRLAEARASLERAVDDARAARARAEEATARVTLAGVRRMLGEADPEGTAAARRLAVALDDPWIEASALSASAVAARDPAEKAALLDATVDAAARAGHAVGEAVARGNRARMLLEADAPAAALAEVEAGLALGAPWPYVHRWLLGFAAGALVDLGRLDEADAALRRADALPVEADGRERAGLGFERAAWHVARGELGAAIALLRWVEAVGPYDEVTLRRCWLLAALGDPAAAEPLARVVAALDAGEIEPPPTETYRAVVRATAAWVGGDRAGLDAAVDALRAELDRDPGAAWTPDRMRRRLARAFVRIAGAPAAPAGARVAADGAWFEAGGARVDLGRRGAQRRILARLAALAPGEALDVYDLFDAGWPGERADHAAVTSRVYNAVQRLRDAGLRGWLNQVDGGYVLDPAVVRAP